MALVSLVQDMARYLVLVEKAAVDAQDHAGWTPLHEACNNGHVGLAEFLLKSGADPNAGALDGTRSVMAVQSCLLQSCQQRLLTLAADNNRPLVEILSGCT